MNRYKAAVVAGGLSLVLFAGALAGCGGINGKAEAITVNGESLSVGAANFWMRTQQAETYATMTNYGLDTSNLWGTGDTDSSEEESNYGETMKASLTEELESYLVLRQKAGDYGVTIPADLQERINGAAAAILAENTEAVKKTGTSEEDLRELMELSAYRALMYEPVVADTDLEVSDEEAAQKTISYIRIRKLNYDEDGNSIDVTDEQIVSWKAELLSMIQAIEDTGDVATADMNAIKDEIDSNAAFATFSYGSDDTIMDDAVKEAVETLADGEIYATPIDAEDYLYIVRLDAAYDEEATENKRTTIINTRKQENFDAKLDGWMEEAEISESDAWKALTITDDEVYTATFTQAEGE